MNWHSAMRKQMKIPLTAQSTINEVNIFSADDFSSILFSLTESLKGKFREQLNSHQWNKSEIQREINKYYSWETIDAIGGVRELRQDLFSGFLLRSFQRVNFFHPKRLLAE